ncbi:copper resistance CopC family protein [Niallia sp. Krafla_26]|uniref:copper resistance CopC family protein n=1 Tax=Niallia sp. Krafla_26 TaxID=3064703 RepID=UPI003D183254
MIKKILVIAVIILSLMCDQVFAHTALKESSPEDGEVLTETIQQMTLRFTTKIEQTSTIEVTDTNGQRVGLGNLIIEGNEIGATLLQPLGNGVYNVTWKIIGADGHPIEGEFTFTVDASVAETPTEDKVEEPVKDKEEVVETENKTKQVDQWNGLPSHIMPSITGVLLLILIGSLVWLMRREK